MSRKNINGLSRYRSSSLKERIFNQRDRKKSTSVRGRIQSTGGLKSCSEADLKGAPTTTAKYKFMKDAKVRVFTFDNTSFNPWEKLMNNKRFPWSWEACALVLGETELYSPTASGVFERPIPYMSTDSWMIFSIPRLPLSCIKLCVGDKSYLIQTADLHQRDRLLHSVEWKKNVCKYEKLFYSSNEYDKNVLKDLQNLVKLTLEGPLYLDDTHNTLLEIVSHLLNKNQDFMNSYSNESLITTLAPLFEKNEPTIEICNFFTKHCRTCPRSRVVIDMFLPVVSRILKYNTNFGKNIWLRQFVKEYIQALHTRNDGEAAVRAFVQTIHGPLSVCPHKRILNNLITICLSAVYDSFSISDEEKDAKKDEAMSYGKSYELNNHSNDNKKEFHDTKTLFEDSVSKYSKNLMPGENNNIIDPSAKSSNLNLNECKSIKTPQQWAEDCTTPSLDMAILFMIVLDEISSISDWLPGLATLLQPVPFQPEAMQNEKLIRYVVQIIERFADSDNGDVIWCLVSVREQKDGWLQILSPSNNMNQDNGKLFTKMVSAILDAAKKSSKVKSLIKVLMNSCLNAVLLLALRESEVMMEVLCLILEYKLAAGQREVQIISTLRSTEPGNKFYEILCEQEMIMRQKGGPDEFNLPPGSTDQDLQQFLNSGSNGNLRSLNLSFTHITCKSADIISRLPSLQHLNLWSSNMQDLGLRRLCETLNLKTLNLCETNVTDDGIVCLKDMTSLTALNLNSTHVSERVFQELCISLPKLVDCDVDYTDAWPQGLNRQTSNNTTTNSTPDMKKIDYKQNV